MLLQPLIMGLEGTQRHLRASRVLLLERYLFDRTLYTWTVLIKNQLKFASQYCYIGSMTIVKASLLMLYRRIFSLRPTWFSIFWWINSGFVIGYFVYMAYRYTVQCSPLPASTTWRNPAACPITVNHAMKMGWLNAAIDFAILLLPVRIVWTLHLPTKQKLAVTGMFGLGLLSVHHRIPPSHIN